MNEETLAAAWDILEAAEDAAPILTMVENAAYNAGLPEPGTVEDYIALLDAEANRRELVGGYNEGTIHLMRRAAEQVRALGFQSSEIGTLEY